MPWLPARWVAKTKEMLDDGNPFCTACVVINISISCKTRYCREIFSVP